MTEYTVGLTGPNRDAAAALINLFRSYGLETLAPQIVRMVREGMSADTISISLQETPEYKTRFSANAIRIKAGLPALSPGEYLATERSYRQIMQEAGLPIGFYDQSSDFTTWISMDVAPTEVKRRVDKAREAIDKAPPGVVDYLKQWYGEGDLIAFALDSKRALPLIESRISAAEAAATAKAQGVDVSRGLVEQIGSQNFTLEQMRAGFGQVATDATTAFKLSQIYGDSVVTADDLTRAVFLDDANVANEVRRLASQERAAFSGAAGAGRQALATQRVV